MSKGAPHCQCAQGMCTLALDLDPTPEGSEGAYDRTGRRAAKRPLWHQENGYRSDISRSSSGAELSSKRPRNSPIASGLSGGGFIFLLQQALGLCVYGALIRSRFNAREILSCAQLICAEASLGSTLVERTTIARPGLRAAIKRRPFADEAEPLAKKPHGNSREGRAAKAAAKAAAQMANDGDSGGVLFVRGDGLDVDIGELGARQPVAPAADWPDPFSPTHGTGLLKGGPLQDRGQDSTEMPPSGVVHMGDPNLQSSALDVVVSRP